MKRQIIFSVSVFSILTLVTILVILYGKGYRFGTIQNGKPTLSKTGLLVATSKPNGAQVFINGNLTSATDDTIDLIPGEYTVKIQKEGYFPWEKKVSIRKEVVTKAEALLFPSAPKLENITSIGVQQPVLDPSGRRIAFRVASQSAKKNGLYVLDMTTTPILTLGTSAKQLTDDVTALFSTANYIWSPNGEEIMASISGQPNFPNYYLLNSASYNETPRNITAILSTVEEQWQSQKLEREQARLNALPKATRLMIQENFSILSWSQEDDKILYSASRSATLPIIIKPRRIGIDEIREDRKISESDIYVYDIKDDINFKIKEIDTEICTRIETTDPCPKPTFIQWLPDSKHLILTEDNKINIMEYDGTNSTTIYAGPFLDNFVSPWPNSNKLVVLTNFNNPDVAANLYTISLQ